VPVAGMQPGGDAEDGAGRVERGEFGAVAPHPPEDQDPGSLGELVVAGDEHHGLHAAAAYPPGLSPHLVRAVHGWLPGSAGS
jgi:hypothetical protein